MSNFSLLAVSKCTIMIIIMSKFPGKTLLLDFNCQLSKINVLLWTKAVLHTTSTTHCKARQVLRNLFSTEQGNSSDMTFGAGATKINLKNLKTWRHQLWKMWTFDKFWEKSYLSMSLKALKSSWCISAIHWLKIFLIHVIT